MNQPTGQLRAQLEKLKAKADVKKASIKAEQQELSLLQKQITDLEKKIKLANESTKQIAVTDHAVLRYLERVKGIDLDEIRKEIAPDNLQSMVNTLGGNGTFPVEDFSVRMADGKVVTVIK